MTFDLVPAVKGCWVTYTTDDGVAPLGGGQTWVTEDGVGRVCIEYREQHAPPRFIVGSWIAGSPSYEFEAEVYQLGTPECGRDTCVHLGEVPCESECWGGTHIGVSCMEVDCCNSGDCMADGTCYSTVTGD